MEVMNLIRFENYMKMRLGYKTSVIKINWIMTQNNNIVLNIVFFFLVHAIIYNILFRFYGYVDYTL